MKSVSLKTIDEQVESDIKELRDIASYFDERGKKTNGDFLRKVAIRFEVVWGAYSGKEKREAMHGKGI